VWYNLDVSDAPGLSIEQLADRTGVSVRTVRYYISQGLLPGPGSRGKYASYGEDHLARLRLIRRLVEQHVPLAEQRERLAAISADDVRRLLREEERHSRVQEQARTAPSPRDYVSRLLAHTRTRPPAAAAELEPPPATSAAPPRSSAQPEQVQHWELAPGIDLYVRVDAERFHARLIERLLEAARNDSGRGSA
jgi:DNA-binding transcriptional MerR regulator